MTDANEHLAFFIEREEHLQVLERAYLEAARTRKPRVLLVKGDFGIGKTTLVEYFLSQLQAAHPEARLSTAVCVQESSLSTLAPFKDALVMLSQSEPRTRAVFVSVLDVVKELAPAWMDILTSGHASLVVEAVSKTIDYAKGTPHKKYTQENIYAQFANITRKLAEHNPLVIFFDDIHWADESSLGLISYITRMVQDRPVLFLATYRPTGLVKREDQARFASVIANLVRYGAAELEITQPVDTRAYIRARYPHNRFPVELIQRIEALGEGHPFYLAELFTYWQETGLVYPLEEHGKTVWMFKNDQDLQARLAEIPASVTKIVESRLLMMERQLKDVIDSAAVEGLTFTVQVIAQLHAIEELQLYDTLSDLETSYALVHPEGEAETAGMILDLYKFITNFYRQFIYSKIDPGKKRLLHHKIGLLLEQIYGENNPLIAAKLAVHFREARDYVKAVRYTIAAARHEQEQYGWVEAEKYCADGLELCARVKDEAVRSRLHFELLTISARGLYICGKVKKAQKRYHEILKTIDTLHLSSEEHLAFLLDFIDACEDANDFSQAFEYIHQAGTLIQQTGYSGYYQRQMVVYQSWEYIHIGDNRRAVEITKQLLAEIEGDPAYEQIAAMAYNSLGISSSNLSDPQSSAYLRRSAELFEKLGSRKSQVVALLNLADDLLYYGRLDEAVEANQKALPLARAIGDRDSEAYGLANTGRIEMLNNHPHDALMYLKDSLTIQDEIGSDWNKSFVLADLASSYALLDELPSALEAVQQAEPYTEGDPFRTAYVQRARGKILLRAGRTVEGSQAYQRALEILGQTGDTHFQEETRQEFTALLEKAQPALKRGGKNN